MVCVNCRTQKNSRLGNRYSSWDYFHISLGCFILLVLRLTCHYLHPGPVFFDRIRLFAMFLALLCFWLAYTFIYHDVLPSDEFYCSKVAFFSPSFIMIFVPCFFSVSLLLLCIFFLSNTSKPIGVLSLITVTIAPETVCRYYFQNSCAIFVGYLLALSPMLARRLC